MIETEGVIKYQLDFEQTAAPDEDLQELNVWRSILHNLGLIGQQPGRYQGYAYGNVSQRCRRQPAQFIISASQTGRLPELTSEHYVRIEKIDIADNRVSARGPLPPSSEALTHAAIYRLSPDIRCVLHVHDPNMWRFGLQQSLPSTAADIEYGTPAMAAEILRLYQSGQLERQRVLVMAGHRDGVISFGDSIDDAGCAILDFWMQTQMQLRVSD